MAPALSAAPLEESDKPQTHRRRALSSVNNIVPHMDTDEMGLNQPNLAKDSQEMDQILVDLGNADLAQSDLLQAIKTLESSGDTLSTGDADAIFPLTGFDLAEAVEPEDSAEDKIMIVQAKLERKCAFLLRRLRILQARAIGKRVSEEATQAFEKCANAIKKDGSGRIMSVKTLMKRVETTSSLQASAASKTVIGPTYYHASTSKGDASRSASVAIPSGSLSGLEDTAKALKSHLSVVKQQLDSDATASSSGAESNDEAVVYNNPHQQSMAIEKRALWRYQKERAAIAYRWCWLQAQVQELEYKIRQHSDLHRQIREAKGPVQFEGEPLAYEGLLPGCGSADDDPETMTCARVRPLNRETFNKRKIVKMKNLHVVSQKAAKPADVMCGCVPSMDECCPVCTGRPDWTPPLHATLHDAARIALADHSYHATLSQPSDISPYVHISSLTSRSWFRSRYGKSFRGGHHSTSNRNQGQPQPGASQSDRPPQTPKQAKKQHPPGTRLKRGRPPLTRKVPVVPEKVEEPIVVIPQETRGRGRPSTEVRASRSASYDIDNIVIPTSVAANTRPEILTYKEIITPKWRVMELPVTPMNNGVVKIRHRISTDDLSDEEDISESAVHQRHLRAESDERSKYPRGNRTRRTTAETTPTNNHEQITRPYSPRQFPLQEDTYVDMLSAMPDGYRVSSPTTSIKYEEEESTLSPLSPPAPFEGDDPDDMEWDPKVEKVERRKSAFR